MATITHTPLSPPPRYSVPLRPRFNTNPSPGNGSVPYTTPRTMTGQTDTTADADAGVGGGSNGSVGTRQGEQGIKLLPVLPGRQVDTARLTNETNPFATLTAPAPMDLAPSPSPALSINAIPEFPLPPRRDPFAGEAGPTNLGSSSSTHGTSSRSQPSGRPLPARPGPPKPELIPEWEPDVKKHIPDEATLDARIASYARLSEPPPKLRSKVLAREQGVPIELETDPAPSDGKQIPKLARRGALNVGGGTHGAGPGERERLGRLRKPAVNGLVRVERGGNRAPTSGGLGAPVATSSAKGKGRMRDQAKGVVSDLSGIAGEWTLDPAVPRLGSFPPALSTPSRPSLGAYSTRTTSSAAGSKNSLLASDQGHSSFSTATDTSMDVQGDPSTSSIWRKRKRVSQDPGRGAETQQRLPTAVFETDKGNIDVRLAIVDDGTCPAPPAKTGDTVTQRYMGSHSQSTTQRKGLLNARTVENEPGTGSLSVDGLAVPEADSCARVEVLTRKGNVRVELVELQQHRQVALQVISRDGNIFLSIPDTFVGPIQCSTAPGQSVLLLPSLKTRVETIYDDRGESLYYLGQRPSGSNRPPILPPRRLSNRLRRLSQGNSTPVQDYTTGKSGIDSPSAMEVDSPLLLPNASKITQSSTSTFIPTSTSAETAGQPAEQVKESSVYVSSYTGTICIGLHGLEPKHVFKGASTLTGLLDGLGEARKLLKGRIQHQGGASRHFV